MGCRKYDRGNGPYGMVRQCETVRRSGDNSDETPRSTDNVVCTERFFTSGHKAYRLIESLHFLPGWRNVARNILYCAARNVISSIRYPGGAVNITLQPLISNASWLTQSSHLHAKICAFPSWYARHTDWWHCTIKYQH
ncbi:hypothetical protein ElyMa_006014200 [Elysia marginata]|uniref:Uncharacterized protein n=1 Tax=Elysia marginata TaxID=1093978 RepID=A0AAV4GHF1_9GAST|nr:hypothetical protein ElyMa_006014200 [Elysia marginata]